MADLMRPDMTLELEHHVEPTAALASWWSRIGVIPGILATADKCEGLFDQILDPGMDIGQYVKDTTTAFEPGGIHEDEDVILLDLVRSEGFIFAAHSFAHWSGAGSRGWGWGWIWCRVLLKYCRNKVV